MNSESREEVSECLSDSGSKNLIETSRDKEESVTSKQRTVVSVPIMENCDLTVQEETPGQLMDLGRNPMNFYNLSMLNHFDMGLINAFAGNNGLHSKIKRLRSFTFVKPSDRLSTSNSDYQKKVRRRAYTTHHERNTPLVDAASFSGNSEKSFKALKTSIGLNTQKKPPLVIRRGFKPVPQRTARYEFEARLFLNDYKESLRQRKLVLKEACRPRKSFNEVLHESEMRIKDLYRTERERKMNEKLTEEPKLKIQKSIKYEYQKNHLNSLNNVGNSTVARRQAIEEWRINRYRSILAGLDKSCVKSEFAGVMHGAENSLKTENFLYNQWRANSMKTAELPHSGLLGIKTELEYSGYCIIAEQGDSKSNMPTEPLDLTFSPKTEPKYSCEHNLLDLRVISGPERDS